MLDVKTTYFYLRDKKKRPVATVAYTVNDSNRLFFAVACHNAKKDKYDADLSKRIAHSRLVSMTEKRQIGGTFCGSMKVEQKNEMNAILTAIAARECYVEPDECDLERAPRPPGVISSRAIHAARRMLKDRTEAIARLSDEPREDAAQC